MTVWGSRGAGAACFGGEGVIGNGAEGAATGGVAIAGVAVGAAAAGAEGTFAGGTTGGGGGAKVGELLLPEPVKPICAYALDAANRALAAQSPMMALRQVSPVR